MHTVLSVVVVAAYGLLLSFVAVRARAARKFSEFSLAKRALPLALVFGSLAATYVGPAFSSGFVGKGFECGWLFLGIGLAYSLQNILVGLFVAPRLRQLKGCHTLGDAIGQKYDRKCQVLAGVISVGLCAGLGAVMAKAGGDVLTSIFGLPHWSSVIIVVGITALYTTFGGLRASVITDAFQFSAFAIMLPITLLGILWFHFKGGPAAFAEQASLATEAGLRSTPVIEIVALVAAFLLGETLIPPYANRALASKTTRISRNGFVLAGCFSVAWFAVMMALGIVARDVITLPQIEAMTPKGKEIEDFVLLTLFKSTMPAAGYALLLVVLISIIMSSLDSLLNAGAAQRRRGCVYPGYLQAVCSCERSRCIECGPRCDNCHRPDRCSGRCRRRQHRKWSAHMLRHLGPGNSACLDHRSVDQTAPAARRDSLHERRLGRSGDAVDHMQVHSAFENRSRDCPHHNAGAGRGDCGVRSGTLDAGARQRGTRGE
ncbi:MAG: sodium:solute symporter family protein [Planctomycetota bacterium]